MSMRQTFSVRGEDGRVGKITFTTENGALPHYLEQLRESLSEAFMNGSELYAEDHSYPCLTVVNVDLEE